MPHHDCIDWTARPPKRKIPFLILTRGDDDIYTVVPKDFKTLEEIARKEFNLGDANLEITSSCMNLSNGRPARITESMWERLSPYIGCATVKVVGARAEEGRPPQGGSWSSTQGADHSSGSAVSCKEQLPRSENPTDEHDAGAKEKQPLNTDNELDHRPGGTSNAPARETIRDEQDAPSGHGVDHDHAATPENRHEESGDEDVTMSSPRKARYLHRVVSEDENEGNESRRESNTSTRSQDLTVATLGKVIKKERQSDYHSELDSQTAEQPDRPIKQEKYDTGAGSHSQPQSQSKTVVQAPTGSGESHKLMIRVAHRPSKQESKFTTKSTTKVHKVLAGVCKSFGLDVSRATLYLIVSTEDELGEEENLFPCDKNDGIARAGAERDTETRFLLKIAGEA